MAENYEGLPPEIEKLSERLAKDPKSLVFSSLANAYRKHNMVDEAIEILQKGLEVHPNYASARIVLGKCYIDKRMYELAKEQFKKALENDPQNVVVLENLAHIYKTLNQYNEAFDLFKRLLDLDPLNETFEKEVEELKGLTKNISGKSGQYDTFQTIPGQTVVEEQTEEQPEPESDAPTLSDIFKGAPDGPEQASPQGTATLEEPEAAIEKPTILTTAADFSDMFEPKEPEETPPQEQQTTFDEQTSDAPDQAEELKPPKPPIATEPQTEPEEQTTTFTGEQAPITQGSPTMDMREHEEPPKPSFEETMEEPEPVPEAEVPKEDATAAPEMDSVPEPSAEESAHIGGITSAFNNAGPETTPKPSHEEMKDSPVSDTDAIVSELSEELSREEQPAPPETTQEAVPPPKEEPLFEAQPTPPESPQEATPVVEKPPEADQQPTATETLAEIYLSQGFNDKALHIYRELLAKDPENELLKQKIATLEEHMAAESTPPPQSPSEAPAQEDAQKEPSNQERRTQSKNLDSFQDWLKKFQK